MYLGFFFLYTYWYDTKYDARISYLVGGVGSIARRRGYSLLIRVLKSHRKKYVTTDRRRGFRIYRTIR